MRPLEANILEMKLYGIMGWEHLTHVVVTQESTIAFSSIQKLMTITFRLFVESLQKRCLASIRIKKMMAEDICCLMEKRYYLKGGKPYDSVWEVPALSPTAKERMGYPTQKPRTLLERIIRASSKPGDIVLDPFCGCGTAVDAALRLKRQFVGIDISSFAIDLIIDRRLKDRSISTYGIPSDFASATKLAREKPVRL